MGQKALSKGDGKPTATPTALQSPDRQSRMHPRVATMPLDNVLEVSTAVRPSNQHFEEDMKETVQYPRLFLGLLGVWPMLSRNLSATKQFIFSLRIVVLLILLSFIIIPPMLHIILIEKDTRLKLIVIGAIIFHGTNFLKYLLFLLRFKTLRLCMEHVETDWKSIVSDGDRAIMKSNTTVGRSLTLICCVSSWSSCICYYVIVPIVHGKIMNDMNETVRSLAHPGFDIFFDYQSQPTYEIVYITIYAAAFVSFTVTSASCSFTAGFVSHACGMLQIVISRLEAVVDSMEIHKNENRLQNWQSLITQCHIRVLRLTSGIEKAIREICFMEVVSSTIIICLFTYYLVAKHDDKEAPKMVSYAIGSFMSSFNIWLFCYIAERLDEQGRRVGEAAYMIEWYKLPYKSSKDLKMIIIMSNNCPPKITAGRILELSIRSFGSILRLSVTYCNVLRVLTA